MQSTTIHDQVRRFIIQNYLFGQDVTLNDADSFLERGVIDSTGVLELVAFLQEAYGFPIEDEELTLTNLDSIENVAAFVLRKLSFVQEAEWTGAVRKNL